MLVLLLLALTLTAAATAALMRRDLIGRVDDDLQRALAQPVAQQALNDLRAARPATACPAATPWSSTPPTAPTRSTIDPTGESTAPGVPDAAHRPTHASAPASRSPSASATAT